MPYLSASQIESFYRDGFLVVPEFLNEGTVTALKDRMGVMLDEFDPNSSKTVFHASEGKQCRDLYFLESAWKISFFWEDKAWKDGALVAPAPLCVNKIGHALHDLEPEFQRVTYEARVGHICHDLGLAKPMAVQSMYICKQPRIGGEVGVHQDGAFLYTEPQSVLGFWWALDNCTQENGCLYAVPGSHSLGVSRRFRQTDGPEVGTEFVPEKPIEFSTEGAVPVLVNKGDLVLIHNSVVHYSGPNTSENARHAYTIHVVDGAPGFNYPKDNWLQRPMPTEPQGTASSSEWLGKDTPFREIVLPAE